MDDKIAENNRFPVEQEGFRANGDTIAWVSKTEPTPASIKLTPYVSVFANLRGKLSKSTASIAMHVANIIVPLYAVRNGFRPEFSAVSTSSSADFVSLILAPKIHNENEAKMK
jgi:hypothetical protein